MHGLFYRNYEFLWKALDFFVFRHILKAAKSALLKDNTLDAVFTMPDDMFYPGASVSSCCMVFTLGQPHVNADASVTKTFLGYFKDDRHTKRKNGGRVEMYDKNGKSSR